MSAPRAIAIVGVAGRFPGASSVDALWQNVLARTSAVAEVPAQRWPAPASEVVGAGVDHARSARAALLDVDALKATFDRLNLDLPVELTSRLSLVSQLGLVVGVESWRNAALTDVDRARVGVVMANIALPTDAASKLAEATLLAELDRKLGSAPVSADSLDGLPSSLPAGLLARALGLGGGSYTLDAACASSLYAVHLACADLEAGRLDAAIAGGISLPQSLYTQIGFSQLQALSPSGVCAPFDRRADGLVPGEGGALFVLRRLDDAIRAGNRIHAVIRGIGLSNDVDGSLLSPASEGQLRAMRAAYAQALWQPSDVQLVECHGTGTPRGDSVELASLGVLFQEASPVVGSVKSNVGHLLTAAGGAALCKVLAALREGTLPPSANFSRASAAPSLSATKLRVLEQAAPWPAGPRRAAVSGFGFGGINAHLLLEAHVEGPSAEAGSASPPVRSRRAPTDVAIVGMATCLGPLSSLKAFQRAVFRGESIRAERPGVRWFGHTLSASPRGSWLDTFTLPIGRFKIPPNEMGSILPQQLLMLKVAADALADAKPLGRGPHHDAGAIIGLGLDLDTTSFHLRWALMSRMRAYLARTHREVAEAELRAWVDRAFESLGPALDSTRTLGALGGIVPSRIAREFQLGGPSFAVSSEEASGLRAVEVASRMLERREARVMLAGAVDLGGDIRHVSARHAQRPYSPSGHARAFDPGSDGVNIAEGAAAVVLKRLPDALADGDRVYSVIRGFGASSGPALQTGAPRVASMRRALSAAKSADPDPDADAASLERRAEGLKSREFALGGGPSTLALRADARDERMDADADADAASLERRAEGLKSREFALGGGPSTLALRADARDERMDADADADAASLERRAEGLKSREFALGGGPSTLALRADARDERMDADADAASLERRAGGLKSREPTLASPSTVALRADARDERMDADAAALAAAPSLHFANASGDRSEDADEAAALGPGAETRSVGATVGHSGAVSGLASLIGASLSVFHEIVPATNGAEPRAWLRNRAQGPRRATVLSAAIDGACLAAVVEEHSHPKTNESALGSRGVAIFFTDGDEPALRRFVAANDAGDIEVLAAKWYRETKTRTTVQRAFVAASASELLRQLEGRPKPRPATGELAFVFPGSGNHYAGMGHDLTLAMPHVYRALDTQLGWLGDQLTLPDAPSPERMILSQVAHGVSVSDALQAFGIKPAAYIGYSLGESAALFASRTWRARDEMFQRTRNSPLFRTQLAGRNDVAREAWGEGDWHVVVVNRAASEVRKALRGTAALLIVNAPNECVVGGRRGDVELVVSSLGCESVALAGVPTVHLPLVRAVAREYHALHKLETTPPEGVRFYSAAWARTYIPTEQNAADSILANAVEGFDFRALIEQAYRDGVRVFVEPGPQGSCTRMIGRILEGLPHLAVAADVRGHDGFVALLNAVARVAEAQVPVSLEALYGAASGVEVDRTAEAGRSVTLQLGGARPPFPPLPVGEVVMPESKPVGDVITLLNGARAVADAHALFLEAARHAAQLQAQLIAEQHRLMLNTSARAAASHGVGAIPSTQTQEAASLELTTHLTERRPGSVNGRGAPAFDREACLQFAVGDISSLLGAQFVSVDAHPTRVRLPDEPLMLVDRIVSVEGTKGELGPGRIVTEHDVLPGAWYLDGGRAPVCISVEAGQADLFLSAYLGIDFKTRGERVYRLLDAKIVFHRDLPRAGETIRYDIKIDRFIQQGDTWLFFFRFDGTIDGAPFITMFDGCAGFFSKEQLETGRGIVADSAELAPRARRENTTAFTHLIAPTKSSLSDAHVEALRKGDLAHAFPDITAFAGKTLAPALRLPRGRMHLVDRITELDPTGGRFKLGMVHGEADITADKWFLTCHFKDDPVMPGTLMYECCLHTLRVLLIRNGWLTDDASLDIHFEPIDGQTSQLRCRGQVLPTTKKVGYRVEVEEIGYDPQPYVIARASMFADGRHVVEMQGMSVRLRGLTREHIEQQLREPSEPAYDRQKILNYAEGDPSKGFGEPYKPFDRDRRLARLPRPPFLFLDRVMSVDAEPWVVAPGGWVEGEFDVDPGAWFFEANAPESRTMPFSVLLEAALQPCGWLAAYAGSALTSTEDLHFRNLDGVATQHLEVPRDVGTLRTRARMTKTSNAGGMILQEFEMQVLSRGRLVYGGTTGFGFFPSAALAQQVGIRGASLAPTSGAGFEVPNKTKLTMIDRVDAMNLEAGFIAGSKRVDPREWFFDAHFYQDPVMPGSLGLEAMIQLMKLAARERFGKQLVNARLESMALGRPHRWQYRGQVVPKNTLVNVQATITSVTEDLLVADGLLAVDGRVIYSMKDFALRVVPS